MKKITIIFLFFIIRAELFPQTQHIGTWRGTDGEGNTAYIVFKKDSTFLNSQIKGNDTLQGHSAKYRIDYSKNPIWLDITLIGADNKNGPTIHSIIKYSSDNEMVWQKSKDFNSRPTNISINDKDNYIVLRKISDDNQFDKIVIDEIRYVILDSTYAEEMLNQCSRERPKINGTWNPTKSDIINLERNFSEISKLKSEGCCLNGIQIKNPSYYYRQYIGIIINGQKFIYINAFYPDYGNSYKNSDKNYWHNHVINICDGGIVAWGCEYDVSKKKFIKLSVNGLS